MEDIYEIETNADAYRTLRDTADRIEEDPAVENISDYDAVVEIDGEAYGVGFEDGQAKAEAQLREAGAEVINGRENRGSLSAGTLAEDMSEMTVEEAVNAGLEPEASSQESEAGTGSTNLRYGLNKVQAE
ncbi:MAG: hypothetical protein ABEK00_01145 [Candidatus Nanohaloarchaea archaeon]